MTILQCLSLSFREQKGAKFSNKRRKEGRSSRLDISSSSSARPLQPLPLLPLHHSPTPSSLFAREEGKDYTHNGDEPLRRLLSYPVLHLVHLGGIHVRVQTSRLSVRTLFHEQDKAETLDSLELSERLWLEAIRNPSLLLEPFPESFEGGGELAIRRSVVDELVKVRMDLRPVSDEFRPFRLCKQHREERRSREKRSSAQRDAYTESGARESGRRGGEGRKDS